MQLGRSKLDTNHNGLIAADVQMSAPGQPRAPVPLYYLILPYTTSPAQPRAPVPSLRDGRSPAAITSTQYLLQHRTVARYVYDAAYPHTAPLHPAPYTVATPAAGARRRYRVPPA